MVNHKALFLDFKFRNQYKNNYKKNNKLTSWTIHLKLLSSCFQLRSEVVCTDIEFDELRQVHPRNFFNTFQIEARERHHLYIGKIDVDDFFHNTGILPKYWILNFLLNQRFYIFQVLIRDVPMSKSWTFSLSLNYDSLLKCSSAFFYSSVNYLTSLSSRKSYFSKAF